MNKRILTIVALSAIASANIFAQDFTGQINNVYTSYVRPSLLAIVFIVFVVTGLLNYSDFIKGGDHAKHAFFSCVKMALYPAFVLGLAEGLRVILV